MQCSEIYIHNFEGKKDVKFRLNHQNLILPVRLLSSPGRESLYTVYVNRLRKRGLQRQEGARRGLFVAQKMPWYVPRDCVRSMPRLLIGQGRKIIPSRQAASYERDECFKKFRQPLKARTEKWVSSQIKLYIFFVYVRSSLIYNDDAFFSYQR